MNVEYKKDILKRSIYGFFMGLSDIIPGYSGGTTLSLLNFYDKLIKNFKSLFYPFDKNNWWKYLLWLIPFLSFWLISLLIGSIITKKIADSGYESFLFILFGSFSFLCIPIFILTNKPSLINIKNKKIVFRKNNYINLFIALIGFSIVLTIGILVFLKGGIILKSGNSNIVYKTPNIEWLWISLLSIVSGFVMLIPGISGSLVLFISNYYDDIYWYILPNAVNNMAILSIIILSIIIGILINVFLSHFLLNKFKNQYISFSFGMVSSSFITIFLSGTNYYNNINLENYIQIITTIIAILIAFITNFILFYYVKRKRNVF